MGFKRSGGFLLEPLKVVAPGSGRGESFWDGEDRRSLLDSQDVLRAADSLGYRYKPESQEEEDRVREASPGLPQ